MKSTLFLILICTLAFGQNSNAELIKKYEKYDSINTYSKEFPTKLIEGSGIIKNKKNKNIGSIGFSTEVTNNKNGKMIRIKKSHANHYDKKRKQIAKSEITEITIYFDENEIPEFSKYINETYVAKKLIQQKMNYYNLKNIKEKNYEISEIEKLLNETRK